MTETTELSGLEWDEADRIRKALRHANITNLEAAALLEVSKNSISNWVNGHASPRPRDLKAIAEITHVPVEWLRPSMAHGPSKYTPWDLNPEPTVSRSPLVKHRRDVRHTSARRGPECEGPSARYAA